jgi:hypothetical protein
MLKLLLPLLPTLLGAAGGLICLGLGKLALLLIAKLRANPKLEALAPVLMAADDTLEAGVKAAAADAGKPALVILKDAEGAALGALKADVPLLEQAAVNEANALLNPNAAAPQTAPGGATVNMPTPGKRGFARLWLLLALATAALFAAPALAQIESPPVVDHWEVAALTPGLRFNLKGSAPASVAAGSGVALDYLFGKYQITTPAGAKLPVFGVSLFTQGAINLSNLAATESAGIGAGCILFDSVTLGAAVDLIAGGPTGASGLLAGNLSLANIYPVAFYSISLGAL